MDSTSLAVCHNACIHSHKVSAGLAARGRTSTGWLFGFKLHLVFNDRGELLSVLLILGKVDDCKPVPGLVNRLFGKIFADKGYLFQPWFDYLYPTFSMQLNTKLRVNMKNRLMRLEDRWMLRKRVKVETIIDQLKNIFQSEHSRHRSVFNFLVNVLCGLIAYCQRLAKPSLGLEHLAPLPA